MAKTKKSQLTTRIAKVITAMLAGENSKERIGRLLLDLLDSAPTEYDPLATYEAGQWIIWQGRLVQALEAVDKTHSPGSHANEWNDPVASTAAQFGANATDYLVTQKGVVAYVQQQLNVSGISGILPIADETKAGISKRATLQAVLEGKNNTDHVTPATLLPALDQAVQTLLSLLEEQRLFGSDLTTEVSNAAGLAVAVDELNGAGVIGRVIKFMGRLKFIDWLGLGLSDLKTLITDSPLITGGIGYKTVVNVDSIQLFDVRYYNPVAQIWYNATVTWARFLELVRKAITLDNVVAANPVTRGTVVFGGLGLFARANADFADKILVLTDVVIDGQPAHFAEYKTHRQVLLSAIANADQELLDFISSRLNVGGGGSATPAGIIIGVRCADTFTQNPSSTFRITPNMVGVAQAHNLNASGDDILPTLLDKNRRPDQVMTLSFPDANHFVVNYADESYSGYEGGILDLRVVGTTAKVYRVVVHTAGVNRWWQTDVGETKPTLGDTSTYPLARRWKEISAELYGAASLTDCDGGEIEPPVAPTPSVITITALVWTYDGRASSQAFGGFAVVKDNGSYEGLLIALDGQEVPIETYLPMAVISQTIQNKAVNRSFGHGPISEGYHGVRPKRYRYRVQEVGNPDNYLEQVITLDAIADAPNTTAKTAGYKIEYNGSSNVITFGAGPGGGTPPTVSMIPNDLISPFSDTGAYSMRAFGSTLGSRSYDWTENHYVNVPQGTYIVEFAWSDGTLLYDTLTISSAAASGAFSLKISALPTGLRINNVSARKQSNGLWLSEANTGVVAEMCRIAIYANGTIEIPNRWIDADFYDGFYDGRGASVFHEWPQSAPASYIDVWRPKGSTEPRLVMRHRYAVTGAGGGSTDKILSMETKYVEGAGYVVFGRTTAAVEVYQYIIDANGTTVGGNGWLAMNKIGGVYDASGATVERVLPDAKQGRLPGTYTITLSVRPVGSTNAAESVLLPNAYSVVVEGSTTPTPAQGETTDWELDTDVFPANTAQRIEYRFVKGGGVNGNLDRIEFRMADTYADNPMYIDLQLTSGSYNFGRGFQRSSTIDDATGLQLRIAVYDTGAYSGKTLKVGISQQTGSSATLLFQYSFVAPAQTQTGWTRLYPA